MKTGGGAIRNPILALTRPPVYAKSSVMQPNGHLGVVILGAGASSRMGRPKLLLPWDGTTVIGRLISQWRELGAGQITVVRRPEDAALAAALDRLGLPENPKISDTELGSSVNPQAGSLRYDRSAGILPAGSGGILPPVVHFQTGSKLDQIINPQPERGMFSSILCAANWTGWHREITNWAIVLGDQPHLHTETLRTLLAFSVQNRQAICQPMSGGRTAHPVILPQTAFDGLKSTRVATLKEFLNLAACPGVQCVINDPGLTLDLDTPEDYKRLQEH
jgi:molybdenum cofactor cytidylyltransferase